MQLVKHFDQYNVIFWMCSDLRSLDAVWEHCVFFWCHAVHANCQDFVNGMLQDGKDEAFSPSTKDCHAKSRSGVGGPSNSFGLVEPLQSVGFHLTVSYLTADLADSTIAASQWSDTNLGSES